jgi:hypothetical protein
MCLGEFLVVPAERQREPGPILRSESRGHGVWVAAFAGMTVKFYSPTTGGFTISKNPSIPMKAFMRSAR